MGKLLDIDRKWLHVPRGTRDLFIIKGSRSLSIGARGTIAFYASVKKRDKSALLHETREPQAMSTSRTTDLQTHIDKLYLI